MNATRPLGLVAALLLAPPQALAAARAEASECWGHPYGATCAVRGNLREAPRVKDVPVAVAKQFSGPIRAYRIDLDSDGRPDWIVVEGPPPPATGRTCFVDSTPRIRSCASSGGDGFAIYWFAQLDADPMLELFAMEGDDDSSDYRIQKLDPRTWARRDLVAIDPVLITDEKPGSRSYWGYPWDVTDVVLKRDAGRILLRAAPRGAASLDGGSGECAGIPDEECGAAAEANVAVVFRGTPTQEGPPEGFARAVKASRLVTLAELVRMSKAPPTAAKRGGR